MSYKRQLWTSGYEYHIRCPYCGTTSKYHDKDLGYRSWYPNGFIYCPKCRKPLRHNEIYAVYPDGSPVFHTQAEADASVHEGYFKAMGYPIGAASGPVATPMTPADVSLLPEKAYCTKCGKQFTPGKDHFCAGCGNKLD